MITPWWFEVTWGIGAAAYFAVCVILLVRSHENNWKSLFAIGVDRVVFYVIAHASRTHYLLYFYAYWINAGLLGALQIWLIRDIFTNMPASRWLPDSIRFWTPYLAGVAGLAVSYLTAPTANTHLERFLILLNRSAQYSFGAVVATLLVGVFFTGFAFTKTGFQIALAGLLRTYSSILLSLVLGLFLPRSSTTLFRVVDYGDTLISLCVAVLWARALARESAVEHEAQEDWEAHKDQLRELLP